MTTRGHSDFEARQLMLFGAATIVLLVFAWTFAYLAYHAVLCKSLRNVRARAVPAGAHSC